MRRWQGYARLENRSVLGVGIMPVRIAFLHAVLSAGILCQAQNSSPKPLPKVDPLEMDVPVSEPVDIGHRKQLFVDRYIVAKTEGVDLTVMPPQRSPDNPCFCPEKNVDQGHGMFPDTVIYDPVRHVYRMWYTSLEGNPDVQFPAYAESADGVHWIRPTLNLRDFHGSKANNLLAGDPGVVIFDPHETLAERRYKRVFTV